MASVIPQVPDEDDLTQQLGISDGHGMLLVFAKRRQRDACNRGSLSLQRQGERLRGRGVDTEEEEELVHELVHRLVHGRLDLRVYLQTNLTTPTP